MKRILKVGIIQQSNTGDINENRRRIIESIESLASQGAQLVVNRELHDSLYFCQTENTGEFDLATSIPGNELDRYCETAARCGVVLVTSLFERRAPGLYHNTAVVIEKDG